MNYSQNNEQEVILNYFNGRKGVFIDIGANDGITLSNTRALAEMGWKGVLIDASPKAFERLVNNYKSLLANGYEFHHCALSSTDGRIILNDSSQLISPGDIALVSTVHQHEMDRFKSVVQYEPVEVASVKWETLIKASSFKHFDFISIDIEGCELDVLPKIDLSQTQMLCIEWNGKQELKFEYEKYLAGFSLIYTSGENLIYVR